MCSKVPSMSSGLPPLRLIVGEIDKNGLLLVSQELWSEALSNYKENSIHPTYLLIIEETYEES